MERRLAAILAADVVGYSRLVRENEEQTLQAFRLLHDAVVAPAITGHGGRIVKLMGDGILAEFPSVVEAIRVALILQQGAADRSGPQPENERLILRIGVHLGDVVIDGQDIHGDGVNVAARLESLAHPGGIAMSAAVHEQVRDRIGTPFTRRGEQSLKNIERPVEVWEWRPDVVVEATPKTAGPALPDKPSIAVLPFDNRSNDPDQEYFADGLTEDLITALSRFRWFFVIARNSTFVYKGQAVDIGRVGRELGVRYVLEGSVRKAGGRVRVTAQLIEAESGTHVWAERYDRELEDIFELQDEITATIAAAVEPELAGTERQRALLKPTEDLDAWDLFQRGVAAMWRHDRASIESGYRLIEEAIGLDPDFGRAHGHLAFGTFLLLVYEWVDDRDEALARGIEQAARSISIDQRDYFAFMALGRLNTIKGDHAAAVRALESSVGINPSFSLGYVGLGEAHVYGGDPRRAIDYLDTAVRFSPNDPMMWDMLHYKASAYLRLDDYEQAIRFFEEACEKPGAQYPPHVTLAAVYCLQGRLEEAKKSVAAARRLEPAASIEIMKKLYGVTEERPGSRASRLLEALRQAGLPERSAEDVSG